MFDNITYERSVVCNEVSQIMKLQISVKISVDVPKTITAIAKLVLVLNTIDSLTFLNSPQTPRARLLS